MPGPLSGLRVIELGGMGPAPFAAMLLADHGADVIRVDRPGGPGENASIMLRSRRMIELDLKDLADVVSFRALLRESDALIDPFRPGVTERLGLGPEVVLADNPRLVYARVTGWGQDGPLASAAGHDINYIALSGALHAVGPAERPVPPLALLGDLGGGGMMLAFAICSALLHAQRTGEGQIIDCAMVDGAGLLMTPFYELYGQQKWSDARASNQLDGGAPFYNAYPTADGRFISIGPLEPRFYALLLERLGLADDPGFAHRDDPAGWGALRARFEQLFLMRTRDEWCALLEGSDACFAPVLSMAEAPSHPHASARSAFVTVDGIVQPSPAPRFSVSTLAHPEPPIRAALANLVVEARRSNRTAGRNGGGEC